MQMAFLYTNKQGQLTCAILPVNQKAQNQGMLLPRAKPELNAATRMSTATIPIRGSTLSMMAAARPFPTCNAVRQVAAVSVQPQIQTLMELMLTNLAGRCLCKYKKYNTMQCEHAARS